MLKESVTIGEVCTLLNELLALDPDCIQDLFSYRVPCGSELAEHPTVQVLQFDGDSVARLGVLGLLNGFFGIKKDGFGPLCMEMEKGKVVCFKPTPAEI